MTVDSEEQGGIPVPALFFNVLYLFHEVFPQDIWFRVADVFGVFGNSEIQLALKTCGLWQILISRRKLRYHHLHSKFIVSYQKFKLAVSSIDNHQKSF